MCTLPFIKMHGLGNDYIYIDCFSPRTAQIISKTDLTDLARRVSDRHRGIGSDGLVLILPSKVADAQMRIFNADGSEAKMCGNAARCIGKYLYESGRGSMKMTLETLSGIKQIAIQTEDEKVALVTVNMGKTIGNPHQVFFVERPNELDSFFEHLCIDSQYADLRANTNIECAYVLDRHTIRMRVHERGSGETMACGTGACATAAEAMDKGFTAHEVHVLMPGGEIFVRRDEQGDIFMTGSATEICRGDYILEE
ncbi:MAG: diaminopimelate epimerase [Paludibacteraceae bacterium]|nr:diaminopimelate epimerase [Paludibacteraceae bacterium]